MPLNLHTNGLWTEIELDTPGKGNCINAEDLRLIAKNALQPSHGTKAIRLSSSSSEMFSSGYDLKHAQANPLAAAQSIATTLIAILSSPNPVAVKLGGRVIGAGVLLAMAADLRIAARNTQFEMPELRLGMPPFFAEALLEWNGAIAAARPLLIWDTPMNSESLLVHGLVDHLSESDGACVTPWHSAEALIRSPVWLRGFAAIKVRRARGAKRQIETAHKAVEEWLKA